MKVSLSEGTFMFITMYIAGNSVQDNRIKIQQVVDINVNDNC